MARRTLHLPALVAAATLLACLLALLAASHEAEAAFPGENGRIVFESFRGWDDPSSLTFRDPETGTFTRLTNNDGTSVRDEYPAVSPDGTRVAYLSYNVYGDPYNPGIYVADADGSGAHRITDNALDEREPAWSPDGRKIAFSAGPAGPWGQREVYVVDADGSDRKKITDNALDERGPAWSPDGTRMAFTVYGQEGPGVYVMGADGTGARRVADGGSPSWSPDGGKLAFSCGPYDSGGIYSGAICTANPDGSDRQEIVTDRFEDNPDVESVRDHDPAWSPDGARIAFARDINFEDVQGNSVYTMDVDGSNLKIVAGYFPRASSPDWGPAPGTQPSPGQEPPETTIISGPSGLAGPSASFDFVSSRLDTSFECSLDGADFSPCEGPKRYEALPDGGHAFEVRAIDATAGADPTPARLAWDVDARRPKGSVAVDGGRARTRDRSVDLALEAADPDPGSGVREVRLRNRGGEWKAWLPYAPSAEWRLSGGEGTKTVLAQYRDGAGNVSEVARDSIIYRR